MNDGAALSATEIFWLSALIMILLVTSPLLPPVEIAWTFIFQPWHVMVCEILIGIQETC